MALFHFGMNRNNKCHLSPPGNLFLRLILTQPTDRDTVVLPLPAKSPLLRKLCLITSWTLLAYFLLAFIVDLVDLFAGGYKQEKYYKSNPMIVLIGYSTSLIDFIIPSISILFLIIQSRDIIKSAEVLESLLTTFAEQKEKIMRKVLYSLRILKIIFVFAVIFAGYGLGLLLKEDWFYDTFWNMYRYAGFEVPYGIFNLYFRFIRIFSALISFPSKALFAYFNLFLCWCYDAFIGEMRGTLHNLEEKHCVLDEEYVGQLKLIQDRGEKVNSAFDQLQKTFSVKLLIDMVTNLATLCITIAEISKWSSENDLNFNLMSILSILRFLLVLGVKLSYVWLMVIPSINLFRQYEQTIEILEKIVAVRQTSHHEKPTESEEVSLTVNMIERFKTKRLLYNAGGVFYMGTFALSTLLASVTTFAAYVMDRAKSFKNTAQKTPA